MHTFNEFVDRKTREAKKQLEVVKKILDHNNFNVSDFLDGAEPYLFLRAPESRLSFDGVRIYKIGDTLAYRVQREQDTHPYGKSYNLNLEEMFEDFMSDGGKQEDAGKKVINAVTESFKDFFEKSASAEDELKQSQFDKNKDPLARSTGTDYANKVQGWTHGTK
jgi:hypothetical protein